MLDIELRVRRLADAATLAKALGVSHPTILRIIQERGNEVIRIGTTKNARYALRRSLRGNPEPIPVYKVDEKGKGSLLAYMHLADPEGAVLDVKGMGWPAPIDGSPWWDGLPYPLTDMRPQGFLGRSLARQIAKTFGVSENPEEWSDDDVIHVLTIKGNDNQGNLIIGDTAYQDFLHTVIHPVTSITEDELSQQYIELAQTATRFGGGGSSAGGEFPKFTAKRMLNEASNPYVIVKFSGADDSPAVRRWSDLLVCEHLALDVIRQSGSLCAPLSRIIQAGGRTFLEVERFDRVGEFGRIGTASLASLDNAYVGMGSGSWIDAAQKLVTERVIPSGLVEDISLMWWFGKLIANTDMHFGNLTFMIEPSLKLSPAYDMLPMLYAPLAGGEVPLREFELSLPKPQEEPTWSLAFNLAIKFWEAASKDVRITNSFRALCEMNLRLLQRVDEKLGMSNSG
ncbi:type II toxin-antitoxin system HipA family toxin YjjJ [Methylophilus methylotrophus]|uniref:type II toxin-antitoxin system HipA family toxin YjjJ n=1 Tax=Methylophilus methylotrophus TaxID=17 RepID=UPI00036F1A20|nr:type II toxin-antitoxin system HipA family toxin YjjJ [Methylophilus methylotrophus]